MSNFMIDEARLREIVRMVVAIVLEEMETAGKLSGGCIACPSAQPSQTLPPPEGVSCSQIVVPKPVAPPVAQPAAPMDWRSKKLVTEHEIKQAGRDISIIIGSGTIVTPLAADTARDRGIILKKE